MKMRPDQERVRNLLMDTVTLLCKNGLDFKREMKVQGLIGITLDDEDVFLVHFDELSEIPNASQDDDAEPEKIGNRKRGSDVIDLDLSGGEPQPKHSRPHHGHHGHHGHSPMSKRLDLSSTLRQQHPETKPRIKEELQEDVVILDEDQDRKPNVNIEGDIEMDSSQLAALTGTGYHQGGSPAGRGPPPGQGWSPGGGGQPGAPPNMRVGSLQPFTQLGQPSFTHLGEDALSLLPVRTYRPRSANDKPYVCQHPDCKRSFYDKRSLVRHMRMNHAEDTSGTAPSETNVSLILQQGENSLDDKDT